MADKEKPEGILVVRGKKDKFEQAVREGAIEVRLYIESHGQKKEEVADALKNTILNDLKQEKSIKLDEIKFHPVVQKGEFHSGFVECHLAFDDIRALVYVVARYGPSAVEVLSPDKVTLNKGEMQALLSDMSSVVQGLSAKVLELMTPELRDKVLREGLNMK